MFSASPGWLICLSCSWGRDERIRERGKDRERHHLCECNHGKVFVCCVYYGLMLLNSFISYSEIHELSISTYFKLWTLCDVLKFSCSLPPTHRLTRCVWDLLVEHACACFADACFHYDFFEVYLAQGVVAHIVQETLYSADKCYSYSSCHVVLISG